MNNRKRKSIIVQIQAFYRKRRPIDVTFTVTDLSSVIEKPTGAIGPILSSKTGPKDGQGFMLSSKIKKIKITRNRHESQAA